MITEREPMSASAQSARRKLIWRAARLAGLAAVLTVAIVPSPSTAQDLTLAKLFAMPVDEAVRATLGERPEAFVERSPWNDVEPNYVLDTVRLFGMSFFTAAQRISPTTCMVTSGHVTFDTFLIDRPSAEERAAFNTGNYGARPLRILGTGVGPVYFAAGPAKPVPLVVGGPLAPMTEADLADDSCSGPVSGRQTFAAPSADIASLIVTHLGSAIASAKGSKRLTFRLEVNCDRVFHCSHGRGELRKLDVHHIDGLMAIQCRDAQGSECYAMWLGETGVELGMDGDDRLISVRISRHQQLVI